MDKLINCSLLRYRGDKKVSPQGEGGAASAAADEAESLESNKLRRLELPDIEEA